MDPVAIRRRLAASRAARLAALPVRLRRVVGHNARVLRQSARWLLLSREHTNFTYNLTTLNQEQLAWFVSTVAGVDVGQARGYLAELERDEDLRAHVARGTAASARRGIADPEARYGRRGGWYALVRALRPSWVVETGTDKGLGSCVLAAALLRNGSGRLLTIDVNPESGYLLSGPYRTVTDVRIGDSLDVLRGLDHEVDFFLHDSDHTASYERAELQAVAPHLSPHAVVLSDNCEVTDELARWAERTGRQFHYFAEQPADHWFPGGGIGIAVRRRPPVPGGPREAGCLTGLDDAAVPRR
jgi:hypothetical protein